MAVTELPFERAAMRGEEMPSGLRLAEQKTYLALRLLYAEYHKGNVAREQAAAEKRKLIMQMNQELKIDKLNERIAQLWKKIEAPAREYSLNPSIETADRFYAAVFGLGENWRLNR